MAVPASAPVAVLASQLRAEEKALLDEFDRRRIPVDHVDARRLRFALDGATQPWMVALNREISGTRARYAALALEVAGVRVVNPSVAAETCGDKWLTSVALYRAQIQTPRTVLALSPEAALDEIDATGYPVVSKPLGSSWGRRVSLLRERDAAEAVLEHCAALPDPRSHLIYLQEYIDKPGRDIRVVVIGDEVVAATYREASHWRTNVALGATTRPCRVSQEVARLAVAAARAVHARVAGVDIVEDKDGRLLVLEVNQRVEFAGLQRAYGDLLHVPAAIVDLVAAELSGVLCASTEARSVTIPTNVPAELQS